jgi:hypothetical protein
MLPDTPHLSSPIPPIHHITPSPLQFPKLRMTLCKHGSLFSLRWGRSRVPGTAGVIEMQTPPHTRANLVHTVVTSYVHGGDGAKATSSREVIFPIRQMRQL